MAQAARRVVRAMPQIAVVQLEEATVQKKLKVAAYARVSTDKEEQEDSFERQVEHYTNLIKSNPEWEFVRVYPDPGITGTKAEKRPEFMKMIEDCRAGKIEKIMVKSVSRFARNTVDALNYIRELRDMNVSVQFESENIDTLTPGGEVLLTILAAMAEQESRTMSNNIKWAYQKKFEKGEVTINTGLMLGYRKAGKDGDGRAVYEIVEEWGCANRIVNGRAVCDSHHINEDVLYATYHAAVKAMIEDAGALLEVIQTETEVEMQPRNKAAMDEVEQQIIELQERVLDLHKQKRAMKISDAYYNTQVNDYSQQLGALESRKQALQTADARYATVRMWLADFRQHMQEGDATDDRDGSIMKTLVEAIIVWDDRIEVRFKCGATVEQKYVA